MAGGAATPSRYVLVKLLGHPGDQVDFPAARWPLHLTLMPNFSIRLGGAAVRALLTEHLAGRRPIAVPAEEDDLFGPRREVRVTRLAERPELIALHRTLHDALSAAGAVFDSPEYVGQGYRPHVTVQADDRVRPGDLVTVDAVSIVDLAPGADPTRRALVGTVPLLAGGRAAT